jgi:Transglycosylase-like domain/LysM domain
MIAAPAQSATVYVQPGQTLSGIAAANGLSLTVVEAANPQIGDPNVIYPGEAVYLSGGSSAPQASPSAVLPASSTASDSGFQSCVLQRENSDSYSWADGNGGGAYQFEPSTWAEFAPAGAQYGSASPAQQDQAFQNAVAAGDSSAWSQYDGCQP